MISLPIIVTAIVAFVIYYYVTRRKERYPPGPLGLPFIGNLLSVGPAPHIAFHKWAQKYGSIFSLNLGTNPAVVLNDVKVIKQAFNEPAFNGRPNSAFMSIVAGGKIGIVNTDGPDWVEQRRFILKTLRDFGFGKKSMESLVIEEIKDILAWMKKEEGQPIALTRRFSLCILNILWTILAGERHDIDDPKLTFIMDTGAEAFNKLSENAAALFFPELVTAFPNISGWTKAYNAMDPFRNIFKNAVSEREKSPPSDEQAPRDFIDVYFNEINKTTNPNSSFYKDNGKKSLVAALGDMYGAGSETTSQTLTWSILYFMRHPEIQIKIHDEIDRVVGKSRLPTLADKQEMPYMEAFILEVLRYSAHVPIGIFHNTMNNVEFNGYKIPKDTMIIANQYSVLHSIEAWGDPHNFRPERFLSRDPDGRTTLLRHEAFIPFSIGKRVCIGESLAKDELFLFLTSIFQRFDISPDVSNPSPSMEPSDGMFLNPKPFLVVMKDRFN